MTSRHQDPTSALKRVAPRRSLSGSACCDSPFLLLWSLCMVVMFVFFTGWGLWEIFTLTEAPLP